MKGKTQIRRHPLAALILGLLLATPAGADPGTVVVDVFQAEALVKDDDTVFGNQQDFFLRVRIDGGPWNQSSELGGRDHASWTPPFFTDQLVVKEDRIFDIDIELWDDDDGGDDLFDLDPQPGAKRLTMRWDGCTQKAVIVGSAVLGEFGPGPIAPLIEGAGDSDRGRIAFDIRTSDRKPFSPGDVAISRATPVQTVFSPRAIVEGKPTSFRVDLTSSDSAVKKTVVTVTLDDTFTTVSEEKTVDVPPEGLSVYFFDGSGTETPFVPRKDPGDPTFSYTVLIEPEGEPPVPEPPIWDGCFDGNNSAGSQLPIVKTDIPLTVYMPFDWVDTPLQIPSATLPSSSDVNDSRDDNQPLFLATFPVAGENSAVSTIPYVALFDWGLLGFVSEPAATITSANMAASIAGIDRMVLLSRNGWFNANGWRSLTLPGDAIGMSLGEFGPRAVIAEAGYSQVVVHELGHTYKLSQHSCSNGGLAEFLLNVGCRDEYKHTEPPAPYIGNGFDPVGDVYPAGSDTSNPVRVVSRINIMDGTGAGIGTYNRWIDNFSYDFLIERMRNLQDPELINLSGWVRQPGGLTDPPAFTGDLFSAYHFDGIPDLAEMPLNTRSGGGFFAVRLVTTQGDRIYRFRPELALDDSEVYQPYGFFSFNVTWDPQTQRIELYGPSDPGSPDASANSDVLLFSRNRTPAEPVISTLRAGLDFGPTMGGPQPEPPTIPPGHDLVLAWDATDADGPYVKSTLLIQPPPSAPGYNGPVPLAVEFDGTEFKVPHSLLAGAPGTYSGRIVSSDGINSATLDVPNLFTICNLTNGGIESCDGVDNDCDGAIDNALVPAPVGGVSIDEDTIDWAATPNTDSYDVVRADLSVLTDTGGDYGAAVATCLAENHPGTSLPYPGGIPAPGDAYLFLVRGNNCSGVGSWDPPGWGLGSRDGLIDSSPMACEACSHDICAEGAALAPGCDPCVEAICLADPFCCDTAWDSICVSEVVTVCGLSCS